MLYLGTRANGERRISVPARQKKNVFLEVQIIEDFFFFFFFRIAQKCSFGGGFKCIHLF